MMGVLAPEPTKNNVVIDIFSLKVLISHYRSCDNTLQNSFFQILSNSRAYLRITYEKTNSQDLLGPLLGKQNIQAKEVYCEPKKLSHSWCGTTTFVPVIMPSVVSVDHIKTVKLVFAFQNNGPVLLQYLGIETVSTEGNLFVSSRSDGLHRNDFPPLHPTSVKFVLSLA